MKNSILIILFILVFFVVRGVQNWLFYDPLIEFFKVSTYRYEVLPLLKFWPFAWSVFFRYFLNAAATIGLIWFWLKDKDLVKLAVAIFAMAFIPLYIFFISGLFFWPSADVQTIFYVRKILIHPVITLILLPAFYFYSIQTKYHD